MLKNSGSDRRSDDGPQKSRSNSGLVTALFITVIETLLGSILGLLLGIAHGSDRLGTAGAVGALFGAGVGVVTGILFSSIPVLRKRRGRSKPRMILLCALLGALIGALVLLLFAEGLAMALYLAAEGAIAGGLIGALSGLVVTLFRRT